MTIVFVLVAGISFALITRHVVWAIQSRHWPEVIASIDDVAIRNGEWPNNARYPPWQDVLYRYEVDGKHFSNTRRAFGLGFKALTPIYVAGTSIVIRYQPSNPSFAVLEPGLNIRLVGEFLIGVMILGVTIFFVVIA